MKGYMVVFFTQQNRRYQGKMLGEWIVDVAKEMGLRGATLCTGIEGFGHTGKLHSSHFFELADQPTEIRLAITEDEAERLFKRLDSEEISVFFTKTPVESNRLANSPLSTQTSSDKNGWKTKPCPQVYPLNKPVSDVGHAEPASGSQSTMASLYTSAPHTP